MNPKVRPLEVIFLCLLTPLQIHHTKQSDFLQSNMIPSLTIPFLLILLSTLFTYNTFAADTLTPTQSLADGETLISDDGAFALGFFSPPNSKNRYIGIWFYRIPIQTIVWVANRNQPITNSSTVSSLMLTSNGTLIILTNNTNIIWSSPSPSETVSNPIAQLLNTGNFVVRESNDLNPEFFTWQSFDYPTNTMLPGMKLGWDRKTGLNRNLTSWKTDSDPSVGTYCLAIDTRGGVQQTMFSGSGRKWRWVWDFNGYPDLHTYPQFTYNFVNNEEEIYIIYEMADPAIVTSFVVNQSGMTERYVWLEQSSAWSLYWYSPTSQCDTFSFCGPNGICDSNKSPMCECLVGFEPKSPANWALRDGSDGCIRKTGLDCVNGTDGFVKVSRILLPDTLDATVDKSMSLDECRRKCSTNCVCTGYASYGINGDGCIIWSGDIVDTKHACGGEQDLYLRVAAADLDLMMPVRQSRKEVRKNIAIAVSFASGTMLIVLIGCRVWRKKKMLKKEYRNEEHNYGDQDLELPLYDLATVMAATENFSTRSKLGEGGFGPVYKGVLEDGQEVAVKRLSRNSTQGIDEFKNEVMLIANLQHRNLVRLLGCCIQGQERMLIYEYMSNKSLDAFLFDKDRAEELDWQTRYRIITGIARGLLYLHEDSRLRIIHRDLKASNILLDKHMNPKISDFGIARIFRGEEATSKTRRVVGTYGYMSPEYAMDGIFSAKSDAFSFGVLVLEIISGQKNKGVFLAELHEHLLGNAWRLWNEDRALELVDPSMGSNYSTNEVMRCIRVGLLCVQESPEDRPTMTSVVVMLGSQDASFPHPKQPGFTARRYPSKPNSSSRKQDVISVCDESTLTLIEGR